MVVPVRVTLEGFGFHHQADGNGTACLPHDWSILPSFQAISSPAFAKVHAGTVPTVEVSSAPVANSNELSLPLPFTVRRRSKAHAESFLLTAFREDKDLINVFSPEPGRGRPLPNSSYDKSVVEGKGMPPELRVMLDRSVWTKPKDPSSLLVVARDWDAVETKRNKKGSVIPPPVLWVVANIPVNETDDTVIDGNSGVQVVPYHAPEVEDRFLHRVYFSVYALDRRIPQGKLGNWKTLEKWILNSKVYDDEDRGDFMMTAVRHRKKPERSFL